MSDLEIRIIVVVFGDGQVTFAADESLKFEVYALEVTDSQLYPF